MAYEIIWTAEADTDFFNIINHLKDYWSLSSAEKFINNLYMQISKLSKMPSLGRATSKENYCIYKLDKKNVLFFTIENDFLILLSIYPYKKDITKSKYY
jgi:plasmid stabilization system protein ParE